MKHIVGVDLGGTTIKAGLVSLNGKILKNVTVPTEAKKGSKVVFENIVFAIESIISPQTKGIGVGSPGPLNPDSGVIINPQNLPFRNFFMKNRLQRHFKIPSHVDNDANCFALAEAIFGAGKNKANVVGITLGTGLGGGIIINQSIYHGRENGGELGHMTIDYKGKKSTYGNSGHFEEYFSVRAIMRSGRNLKVKTPKDIFNLAQKGNKKAIGIWKEHGIYLGVFLTNVLHSLDPDVIVIGGNLSKAWNYFAPSMNKELKKRALFRPCPIVRSRLVEPGILGAAALHLQK